ncbi:DnaT-like ssDNA-binding protein [Asticcacaulis endophyticus]|uniref:Putative DnaT-like domain-containing protein n=1 Tax=Asticcacaulis endophyticus TaxID=1395890 RepID=A0A918UN51_9CAUL|nr:DnaT-like ssDNA-binding protein [Asticcacaulis endophyticus]GGZ21760.1 hypothetical protein GCM10011273_03180 [Asticcacaulis endophyticus]
MAGYGTDQGFTDWLAANGYTLAIDPNQLAVLRQKGSSYIDATYGARFVGHQAGGVAQERAWPRSCAHIRGIDITDDAIPFAVIEASYHAARYAFINPDGLVVTGTASGQVKRKKVDVIEIEYQTASSDKLAQSITPLITSVDGLLAPYLRGAYEDAAIAVV